jgi:hypothetical protein
MTETTPAEQRLAKEAEHRSLVAEVDNILTADEAPEPTFAERVEKGRITWAKAAAEARQWKRERDGQLQRDQRRIRQGIIGWHVARMIYEKPDQQYTKDLVASLDKSEREELALLLGQFKPDLKRFNGLVRDTDDQAQALAAAALERVIRAKRPDHVLYALLAALCGALSHGDD